MNLKRHNKIIVGVMAIALCLMIFAGCDPSISPEIEKTPSITPGVVSETPSPLPTPEPTPEMNEELTAEPTNEPTPEPTEEPEPTYIVNENTGKFHYPDCFSVDRMKEYNKWEFYGTREELIDMGYKPCKGNPRQGECRETATLQMIPEFPVQPL